jgi:hypothetical protein
MVCDVDLLLNQQDLFNLIVERGYPIVIPNSGMSFAHLLTCIVSTHANEDI